MRYEFKIREEEQPILFTSNKEVLYPKIQAIAKKQEVTEENYQSFSSLMGSLLDILEVLELLLNQKRIRHKFVLTKGEDLEINDHFMLTALKMIRRYCELLDGESVALLYFKLEEIEERFRGN